MALETSFTSKSEFLSIVVSTLKRKRNQTYKKSLVMHDYHHDFNKHPST